MGASAAASEREGVCAGAAEKGLAETISVWQGLALAIWTEFELALPPKGTEINEVGGKLWRITTGQEHGLHLSTTPTHHGNGSAEAWEHCSILCVPSSSVFPLWYHSLWALTWADVMHLSFSPAVCTKEISFVIKGAHSVIGSCKQIFWTLLFLYFLRVSVSHSAAGFYLLLTKNQTNQSPNNIYIICFYILSMYYNILNLSYRLWLMVSWSYSLKTQ